MKASAIMRIYCSTTDKINQKLVYQFVVEKARDFGLKGATAWRGMQGFGEKHRIDTSGFWELTEKLPVIIEIIDDKDKLLEFYKEIEAKLIGMRKGCLVTLQDLNILYSSDL